MSFRRLGVLVAALPVESATKTAIRESLRDQDVDDLPEHDGHGSWSHTELLLAAVVDGVNLMAWSQAGGKGTPPAPTRRPGLPKARAGINRAGVTYLNDLRERRRERGGNPSR